jgi:hypothetical protein
MSSEKELLRIVSDQSADPATRTFAAQLVQELLLRRIAVDLRTLVVVFLIPIGFVLLLLAFSAMAFLVFLAVALLL